MSITIPNALLNIRTNKRLQNSVQPLYRKISEYCMVLDFKVCSQIREKICLEGSEEIQDIMLEVLLKLKS